MKKDFRNQFKPSKFMNPSKGFVTDGEGVVWLNIEGYNILADLLEKESQSHDSESKK